MPRSSAPQEDPEDQFVLAAAVAAIPPDETREGPWYGPWTLRLRMMWAGTNTLHGVSLTYPQYPIVHSRMVDLRGPGFNRSGPPSPSPSLMSWHRKSNTFASFTPPKLTRPPPAPTRLLLHAAELPITPPATHTQAFNPQTPSTIGTISSEQILDPRDYFSTRIPDGVHVAYRVEVDGEKRVLPPKILMRRIVLLKENKGGDDEWHGVGKAYDQVLEQARHAYAEDRSIKTLGALICIGRHWTYCEWFMPDQDPLPTVSEARDGEYQPTPKPDGEDEGEDDEDEDDEDDDEDEDEDEDPQGNPFLQAAMPAEFLEPLFGANQHLDILDANTPRALRMIVDRVIGRNLDIWDPEAYQT